MNLRQAAASPSPVGARSRASLRDYLALARFDHMTKQVFIIPGIVCAYMLVGTNVTFPILSIIVGFTGAILIASANYVINEWLDRSFDAFHPVKSRRVAVRRALSPTWVYIEYTVLAVAGLGLAYEIGGTFLLAAIAFVLSGAAYNVKPFRMKDRVYLDIISESVNSPIRLTLGWGMVDPMTLPPASVLLAFWFGGAFLMGAKRLAEYRGMAASQDIGRLHLYRKSFRRYTAENLTVSCFIYAVLSSFFMGVFLIKYRIEYIVTYPFIAALFTMYFWLAFQRNSAVEHPEWLLQSRRLILVIGLTVLAAIAATVINVPQLEQLTVPYLIYVR